MKIYILILSFILAFAGTETKSQAISAETFVLSNYVFENNLNSQLLTSIIPLSEKKFSYILSGKNAAWLQLKENDIFVKNKFLKKVLNRSLQTKMLNNILPKRLQK